MGTVRVIDTQAIWAMLERCAPGFTKRKTVHHWRIEFAGRTYPTLPLGRHGKRTNPEIEAGHVRKMARFLGIYECASAMLEI